MRSFVTAAALRRIQRCFLSLVAATALSLNVPAVPVHAPVAMQRLPVVQRISVTISDAAMNTDVFPPSTFNIATISTPTKKGDLCTPPSRTELLRTATCMRATSALPSPLALIARITASHMTDQGDSLDLARMVDEIPMSDLDLRGEKGIKADLKGVAALKERQAAKQARDAAKFEEVSAAGLLDR